MLRAFGLRAAIMTVILAYILTVPSRLMGTSAEDVAKEAIGGGQGLGG